MPDLISHIPDPCRQNESPVSAAPDENSSETALLSESVVQAVIFDLDGTLLDTLSDLALAGNQVLMAHGLAAAASEAYRQFVGAGARNLMGRAFAASGQMLDVSDPRLDQLAAEFGHAYDACWFTQTKPYPGVMILLAELSALGIEMIVLSNKPDVFTRKMVRHFFADVRFSAVCGKQDAWPLKPDPSLALDLCSRKGIEPGRTAFVGDSGSDMQTARRGQFLPLGVLWGFRSADELKQNGAACLFHEPAQLTDWLIRHADKNMIRSTHVHEQKGG